MAPFLKSDILRLGNIQRRATRCVKMLSHLPFQYRERMRRLCFICLENRRSRGDLIFTWKLLSGMISCNFILPPTLRSLLLDRLRGHSLILLPPTVKPPKSRIRSNFLRENIKNMEQIA